MTSSHQLAVLFSVPLLAHLSPPELGKLADVLEEVCYKFRWLFWRAFSFPFLSKSTSGNGFVSMICCCCRCCCRTFITREITLFVKESAETLFSSSARDLWVRQDELCSAFQTRMTQKLTSFPNLVLLGLFLCISVSVSVVWLTPTTHYKLFLKPWRHMSRGVGTDIDYCAQSILVPTASVLLSFKVKVTQKVEGHEEPQEIRTLKRGDYFGEKALLR